MQIVAQSWAVQMRHAVNHVEVDRDEFNDRRAERELARARDREAAEKRDRMLEKLVDLQSACQTTVVKMEARFCCLTCD